MKKIMYITALWFVSCLNIWAVPVVVNFFEYNTPSNPYNGPAVVAVPPGPGFGFEYDLQFSVGYRALAAQPCSMDKAYTVFLSSANTPITQTIDGHTIVGSTCIQGTLGVSCSAPVQDFYWSGVRFSIQSPPVGPPPTPLPPVPVNDYMGAVKGGITCASDHIDGILYTPPFPPGAPITGDYVITPVTGIFANGPKMSFVDLGVIQIYNFY